MSERAYIFIQAEDRNGNKRKFVYDHRWGIGRILPTLLMRCVMHSEVITSEVITSDNYRYRFLDNFRLSYKQDCVVGVTDLLPDESELDEYLDELAETDFTKLSELKVLYDEYCGDGENENLVIIAKESPEGHVAGNDEFSFFFIDKDCTRLVPLTEYFRKNEQYCNKSFVSMFRSFMEHFGVEEFVFAT